MTWFRRKFTARRAAFSALLATCALFSFPALAQEAVALEADTTVSGTLTEAAPLMTYSFEGAVGTYDLLLTSDYAQTIVVQVVDATGLSIITEAVGADNAINVTAQVSDAGAHYVVVSSATAVVGTPVDYELTLTALDVATATAAPTSEGTLTPLPQGEGTGVRADAARHDQRLQRRADVDGRCRPRSRSARSGGRLALLGDAEC